MKKITLFLLLSLSIYSCKENKKTDVLLDTDTTTVLNDSNKIVENRITVEEIKNLVKLEYESMNEDLGGFKRPPNVSKGKLEELLKNAKNSIYEKQIIKSIDSLEYLMNKNISANDSKKVKETIVNSYINSDESANPCVISKEVIKQHLQNPKTADFSIFDCSTEKNSDGTYTILRKVSAKNLYGVEKEFIYKLRLGFKGGSWTDMSNWVLIKIQSQEYR